MKRWWAKYIQALGSMSVQDMVMFFCGVIIIGVAFGQIAKTVVEVFR